MGLPASSYTLIDTLFAEGPKNDIDAMQGFRLKPLSKSSQDAVTTGIPEKGVVNVTEYCPKLEVLTVNPCPALMFPPSSKKPRMMRRFSSPPGANNCPLLPSLTSPLTSSAAAGVMVPMPTKPFGKM